MVAAVRSGPTPILRSPLVMSRGSALPHPYEHAIAFAHRKLLINCRVKNVLFLRVVCSQDLQQSGFVFVGRAIRLLQLAVDERQEMLDLSMFVAHHGGGAGDVI